MRELVDADIGRPLQATWSPHAFLDAVKEALSLTGDRALHQLFANTAAVSMFPRNALVTADFAQTIVPPKSVNNAWDTALDA